MQAGSHQPYEDELAAYLLDALTTEESRAFQAHLQDCDLCQARERWLRTSVEVLPSSVEQLEPPPELRQRLLETVRREAGEATAKPAPVRRPSWWQRLEALVARPATALAAVLIVAAGIAGYALRGGGEGGPGTTTVAAQGTSALPSARATIVRSGDRAILRVSNLPQRRGRVYEVWLLEGRKPVPSALFQVGRDGTGSAGIPAGLDDATRLMVTSEPPGGSELPTTDPVISAPI